MTGSTPNEMAERSHSPPVTFTSGLDGWQVSLARARTFYGPVTLRRH
ncbi:hypothetical protein [Thalassovita taeanensis]|nr:hypothetical protein [Thalassovita taeanensis]